MTDDTMDQQPGPSGLNTQRGFLSQLIDDEPSDDLFEMGSSLADMRPEEQQRLYAASTGDVYMDEAFEDEEEEDMETSEIVEAVDEEEEEGELEEGEEEDELASGLLADEQFYKLYINGDVTFDELMKEMHKKTLIDDEDNSLINDDNLQSGNEPKKKSQNKRSAESQLTQSFTKKKKGFKRNAKGLSEELANYLSLADIKLIDGDYDGAAQICFEVIKQASKSPDAYQVLSDIYCRQDKLEAAKNYLFLAAVLSPSDIDKWITLIELARENNDLISAIGYSRRALRHHRNDIGLRNELVSLLEENGELKLAAVTQLNSLKMLPESDGEQQYEVARDIANKFYNMCDIPKSIEAYEVVFHNYPKLGTHVDANNTLDLMLQQKLFERAIVFLVRFCDLKLIYMNGKVVQPEDLPTCLNSLAKISKCTFPNSLPPDITVKLIIVLIYLGYHDLVQEHIKKHVYTLDVEEFGDWYFDIGEAYHTKRLYSEAKEILSRLKKSQKFGKSQMWLTLADSLSHLNQLEDAANAYEYVIQLHPDHLEARITLSSLQHRLGRSDEAMATLDRQLQETWEDRKLAYQRCLMLDQPNQIEAFVKEASKLLYTGLSSSSTGSSDDIIALLNLKSVRHRFSHILESLSTQALCVQQRTLIMNTAATSTMTSGGGVSADDLWDLFQRLVARLHSAGRLERLETSVLLARVLPQFTQDESRRDQADALLISTSLLNRHGPPIYPIVKEWCRKWPDNNQCWNLFNVSVTLSNDLRHNRFIIRELQKDFDCFATNLINAHNCVISGSYRYAVASYSPLFSRYKDNPLLSLMLAITFLNLSVQKFITNRHTIVTQSQAFLKEYRKTRGCIQETFYNTGRALHQLMLCHLAIPFYEKALEANPIGKTPEERQLTDLTKESAYNLMTMYKKSGNIKEAHRIMQKYLHV